MKLITWHILFLVSTLLYTSAYAQSSLTLHLISEGTNIAVDSAEVAIMESNIKTISDKEGKANISGLTEGLYLVSIKHPKYADKTLTLNIERGAALQRDISMVPQLDEVLVTAERVDEYLEKRGFNKRRKQGFGTFLGPEEIEKKGKLNPSDILRNLTGVRLRYGSGNVIVPVSSRRTSPGLLTGGPCILDIYVDGARAFDSNINRILNSTQEVAAAEVYNGPSTIPPRFGQFNSCGAIVIWTKTGS